MPEVATYKKVFKPTRSIELKKETNNEPHVPPYLDTPPMVRFGRNIFDQDRAGAKLHNCHSSKFLPYDIDWNDDDNPQLLSVYVNDIYKYLFKVEKVFPIRQDFLANQVDVTPKMRSVLLDWINEVHNQFSLELETYHMTVSMIDRYLQSTTTTPRRYLQLVGVTTLFMASKYEELMPPEINDFVYVTGKNMSLSFNQHKLTKLFFLLR